jgi:hypothetical protein
MGCVKRAALMMTAVAWLACGRSSPVQDADGGSLSLPFDPVAGCRETSSAACAQCCAPSGGLDQNGGCTIERTNSAEFTADPCPATCSPCARCSEAAERSLAEAAEHARPDCDCPTVDPGIDPCFTPQGCGCFCVGLASNLNACPQAGARACGHGNHCGVALVAPRGYYRAGDQVEAMWINFDSRTAFLDACGSVGLESESGGWATIVKPAPCPSTGVTVALAQNQSWSVTVTLAATPTAWAALFGAYYLDCQSTTPFDPSTCSAGPIEVTEGIVVVP